MFSKFFSLCSLLCVHVVYCCDVKLEQVWHFFRIDEQQQILANNIHNLVEEQLRFSSGQSMWKALLYFYDQIPFVFNFVKRVSFAISLKSYDINTQNLVFEVDIPEAFCEENSSTKTIVAQRPCLIKLNDKYEISSNGIPAFIALAHEFLHALNNLERIQYTEKDINTLYTNENFDELDKTISMQQFLITLLKIPPESLLLQEAYKDNWQNGAFDDSLDEMTVILGRNFKTGENVRTYIGESKFLEELNNCHVVALSHNNIIDLEYWLKCRVVIEYSYLTEIAQYFNYNDKDICNVASIVQENYKWQNIHGIRISPNDRFCLFEYISESLYKTKEPIKIKISLDKALEPFVNANNTYPGISFSLPVHTPTQSIVCILPGNLIVVGSELIKLTRYNTLSFNAHLTNEVEVTSACKEVIYDASSNAI